MTAPPGTARLTSPDLGANQEGARRGGFLSVSVLGREARKVAADMGIRVSGSRARNLVRRYVDTGRGALLDERRAVADFRAWFITYADPTGETASRNADRERAGR